MKIFLLLLIILIPKYYTIPQQAEIDFPYYVKNVKVY